MDMVEVTRDGNVGLVRMQRPEKHNAFNREMATRVQAAFEMLGADEDVHCVVLVGTGSAFCAGADMNEAVAAIDENGRNDGMAHTIASLSRFPKPVIGCINGIAHGGGALLAATCDIRVASDAASFRFPGAVYGLVVGGSQLPRIIGPAHAKELLFTGRVVEAEEALRIGLVNRVVPHSHVEAMSMEMARQIAENSPPALIATKEVVERATEIDDGLKREGEWNRSLRASPEHHERFRAAAARVTARSQRRGDES
jgi:enoyl-CoA hydratase